MSEPPLRVATGTPVVIDTSVAFKWYDTSEYGAGVASDLLDAHGRDEIALIVPAHLPLEVMNVHVTRGAGLQRMLEVIEDLTNVDLLVAPVDEVLLADSARIAYAEGLALYDAVFIALASRLDAELVTADRKQASTASCRVRLID